MTRSYQRLDKERLASAVATSSSFTEVCHKLNKKPVGGTITNIRLTCDRLGIDRSHMTGQGWAKNKRAKNRLAPEARLVMGTPLDRRMGADRLRRSLFDIGVDYRCVGCSMGPEWNNQPLTLEVDHIDGQYWNNQRENLQFLCPNCHAQKTKNTARVTQLV